MSGSSDTESSSRSLSTITTDSSAQETEFDQVSERDPSRGPKYASVLHKPYQPHVTSLPGKVFPKRKIGSRNRSFQQGWYDKFTWLEYSPARDSAYCYACRFAYSSHKVGCADSAFINRGFRNWKSAVEDFRGHEQSRVHKSAAELLANARSMHKRGDTVAQQISSAHRREIALNRRNVYRLFETVLFLGKQGIPFRGHDESISSLNKGNYLELLHFRSRECAELSVHLSGSVHYASPQSQNEMIQLIGKGIQAGIVKEMNESSVFGIICDETMDISRIEQFSMCVRYVTTDLRVRERFLGFWKAKKTDGESLLKLLLSILTYLELNVANIRAQCYDGAASMRGKYSGLATRVKELEPRALYIHCHAHLLNLTLQCSLSSIKEVRNVLGTVNRLYDFLEASAKRHERFQEIQKALISSKPPTTLKHLCETRWASRYRAVHSLKSSFEAVLQTLLAISDEDPRTGHEADSLHKAIASFAFFFYVTILDSLLKVTSVLSDYLQGEQVLLSTAKNAAASTISTLKSYRSDAKFDEFWAAAEHVSSELDLEPMHLPRKRKVPRRFDEGTSEGDCPDSPEAVHRPIYFQLIDLLESELKHRFSSNNHEALIAVETLLTDSIVKPEPSSDYIRKVKHFYGDDFNLTKLEVELSIFYHQIKNEVLPSNDIKGLCQVFGANNYASLYPEVHKLFKIYLVVPVASAGAERSFSTLRRVKSWMRSTMTEDRVSSLALMCIEKEATRHLEENIDELVSQFSNSGRRLALN